MRAWSLGLLAALALLAIPLAAPAAPAQLTWLRRVAFDDVPNDDGNDVAIRDGWVYVASYFGVYIVDARDPAQAHIVSSVPCKAKDIGVLDHGGRRLLTASWQGGNDNCPGSTGDSGVRVIDATDPYDPVVGGQVSLPYGSHTNTPYGDTGLVYNNAYDLTNPYAHHIAEIVDVRDPVNPSLVTAFEFPLDSLSPGCHDIWAEPARHRGICAGITETQLWDTSDPLAPVILGTIRNPFIDIHHNAATLQDGTVLALGAEFAGAGSPGACLGGRQPTGAIWFYDITVPSLPLVLGWWSPPAASPVALCTVHNFNVAAGTDIVVGASYNGGSFLLDASDPSNPVLLDQDARSGPSSMAWSTYEAGGYAFAGDFRRGLDVYRLD